MKKAGLLLLIVFALSSSPAWAQKVEITPWYGYTFGGSLDVVEGRLSTPASGAFGFTFDVRVSDDVMFEFLYSRQDTKLRFQPGGVGPKEDVFDMAVEYYHGGGLIEFGDETARPYIALGAGVTRFAPKPEGVSSEWRFSASFGGGVKVLPSDHIGFRVEGRILVPFYGSGFTIGCGAPGGCWTGVSGFAATLQGNVNGGLIIAF
jgi:opacity protein-like surface antigen